MMRQFYGRDLPNIENANNLGCNHAPMFIIGLLLLVITALIIIMLLKHHKPHHHMHKPPEFPLPPSSQDNSMEILNQRLAKGEVTPEEYAKIKELLTTPQ